MGKFRVHSAHETTKDVAAKTADGTDVIGKMPMIIAELVSLGPDGGTFTYHETDLQKGRPLLVVGAVVEVTVTAAAA